MIILAGDLNTEPGDLAYRIILAMVGFTDSFTEAEVENHETSSTCENLLNSYTPSKLIKKQIPGKRIDYILYSGNARTSIYLKKYLQPLPDRVPECNYSYSDHEAVAITLTLEKTDKAKQNLNENVQNSILKEGIEICEDALKKLVYHKQVYWFFSALLLMGLTITMAFDVPGRFFIAYHIFKVLLSFLLVFTVVMASLWNRIESHAILAGKLGMEVSLKRIREKRI